MISLTECASLFVQFVMETFGIMREKEVEMNNKGHLLIIQALCKGGYVEEV